MSFFSFSRHVLSIATLFSQLAFMADKANSAFKMMNTLMLRMSNTSKEGIDAQAMVGLAQCSRNLNKKREVLAELQRDIQVLESERGPDNMTLDNCDTRGSHTTVAYTEIETTDTSHFSTTPMSPEALVNLFSAEILKLSSSDLEEERDHLLAVAMLALARYLSEVKEELGHWKKFLPVHHPHPTSDLPLHEAHVRLEEPLYYQVTRKRRFYFYVLGFSPELA